MFSPEAQTTHNQQSTLDLMRIQEIKHSKSCFKKHWKCFTFYSLLGLSWLLILTSAKSENGQHKHLPLKKGCQTFVLSDTLCRASAQLEHLQDTNLELPLERKPTGHKLARLQLNISKALGSSILASTLTLNIVRMCRENWTLIPRRT